MDQLLTVFGIDWKLLLAQTINFLILLGVLSYFLYRPMMRVLADRAAEIKKGLEDAQAAATARAQTEAERAGIVADANKSADTIVRRATDEAKAERVTLLKAAEARAEQIAKDAAASAQEAARRALKEAEAEIAKTAILAAEKILIKNS